MFFHRSKISSQYKTALARVKTDQLTLEVPSKIYAFVGEVPSIVSHSHAGGAARTLEKSPIQLIAVGMDEFETQEVIDFVKKIDNGFNGDATMSLPGTK